MFFLKAEAPRLTGTSLSNKYAAISALSIRVGGGYYYVVVTRAKHNILMFSLKELLQEFSEANHDCIFLSLSQPDPQFFLSVDLFFCGGCVFFTPAHWDYCLPAPSVHYIFERSFQLTLRDFVFLEKYFQVNLTNF